mmetsp:Transcript_55765/g.118794  ORF Transcript_55765/g.118794 Transcript_55765/m.118794 type:complete len:221 (-) Transcript_55765:203-865(-)
MFWKCCCAPPEDIEGVNTYTTSTEEVLDRKYGLTSLVDPSTSEEGAPTLLRRNGVESEGKVGVSPYSPADTDLDPDLEVAYAHSGSASCFSPSIDAFARSAAKGRKITLFSEAAGTRFTGSYQVLEKSGKMLVYVDTETGRYVEEFSISDIEDIFQMVDGDDCFPPAVMSALTPEEHDSLFMIVYRGPSQEDHILCLLEESDKSKGDLLQLLHETSQRNA